MGKILQKLRLWSGHDRFSAWVLMNLKQRNPQLHEYTMRTVLADRRRGLQFLRRPMGASDFTVSPTYYTYCDVPSPDLGRFSIAHDRPYIIPALKDALRLNPRSGFSPRRGAPRRG